MLVLLSPVVYHGMTWAVLNIFTIRNYYLGIFLNEKKINLLRIMILMQNILGFFCDADEQCYKYNLESLKIDFNTHNSSS